MRNINKKCVVQNAENKKDVILKKAKNEEESSMFGITVEQLVSTYDFSHEKYESTLAEDIISLCQEKGIYTDGIFQQKTCVLRNNYWNLKSNKFHIPKKEILFAICIGLKLNIEKTVQLLAKGGYSFTYNSEFEKKNSLPSFERLIHDCICMRIYDIDEINQFLIDNGYKERLGSRTLI